MALNEEQIVSLEVIVNNPDVYRLEPEYSVEDVLEYLVDWTINSNYDEYPGYFVLPPGYEGDFANENSA